MRIAFSISLPAFRARAGLAGAERCRFHAFSELDFIMATKKKAADCRQYRIGDFARYLGVTAEFLKHYQESGLLDVTQRASGYRYYGFDQSARILQYLRLRNYGLSVKEMGPFLAGGLDRGGRVPRCEGRGDARADRTHAVHRRRTREASPLA